LLFIIAQPEMQAVMGKRKPFQSGPMASSSRYQHWSPSRITKATPSAPVICRAAERTTAATPSTVRTADSASIVSTSVNNGSVAGAGVPTGEAADLMELPLHRPERANHVVRRF